MFALLVATSVACWRSPQAIADVDALVERMGASVWQVESDGCGWKMRGSAFAIDARHLVTNHHVIANDSSPIIRSRDGKERTGRVIGATAHPDVAVIEVADDLPAHRPWAVTSSLVKREPLVVIGYPSPAYVFKASTGRIVNFQGPDGTHEAALVNAPVARGSSGGPGLRGDASVAGVVTQMTIREKPEERVAIVFTADAVRPAIKRFLRKPSKVLSSCGLGPDYVPPVPESYEIKEAPPTAEPVEALPVPTVAPRPPDAAPAPRVSPSQRSPARVTPPPPCPEGGAAVEVSKVTATEKADDPGWWRVDARGSVRNDTADSLNVDAVDVRVDGEPPVTGRAGQHLEFLAPGQETGWVLDEQLVYSPSGRPTRAEATVYWHWSDRSDCPSDDVTSSGPDPTPAP